MSTGEIAEGLDLLRRAGASAQALAKFEREMSLFWPEDRVRLVQYLAQQSSASLASYVERLLQPSPDDQYVLGPDHSLQPGTPEGSLLEFTLEQSSVFPGTTRTIRVYVPAAYTAETPACVYVNLDDLFFPTLKVLDNLLHRGEIPLLIAIGVRPGAAPSSTPSENPRFNRSLEFDTLSDRFVCFLLEELLPAVERQHTAAGLPIILSRNPNDRAIGGMSTGGIGAFTVAWERPDAFRRVFTTIATFVGMRGGDRYPVLVRKTEPKPLRIFMQDGSNDELSTMGEIGDWWMSNQLMQGALQFAGYQVTHVWGEGTHSPRHAITIFPEVMRWLWRGWPQPVTAGQSRNSVLKRILRPDETWQVVSGPYGSARALASDSEGTVLFWDEENATTCRITTAGTADRFPLSARSYTAMAFGPDGRAYVNDEHSRSIVAYDLNGQAATLATDITGSHLIVSHSGIVYVTERGASGSGNLWMIRPEDGSQLLLDGTLTNPSGVALSPDGQWLAVAEGTTHWGYSYRIQPAGSVDIKQQFYWFHVPDYADDSGAAAWVMDREGYLYAATRMGVQVFDRNGRVRAILPVPGGEVTGLAFGGTQFDVLYVSCVDHKIYRRQLNTAGALAFAPPIRLPIHAPS